MSIINVHQDLALAECKIVELRSEVEGLRAEVERLTRELDEAKDRAFDHERCAMGPLVGAEGACTPHPTPEAMCCACRLRAAAIPADAEERVRRIIETTTRVEDCVRAVLALRGAS